MIFSTLQCTQLHKRRRCVPHKIILLRALRFACAGAARKEANRTCTNHHQGESHCSSTLAFSHAPHSRNSSAQFASHLHARPHYKTKCMHRVAPPPHKKSHNANTHGTLSFFSMFIFHSRSPRVIAHRSEKYFSSIDTVFAAACCAEPELEMQMRRSRAVNYGRASHTIVITCR